MDDQDRSRDFYTNVLGAEVVMVRDPVILKFHNSWIIINVGGGPTEDTDPEGSPERFAPM